MNKYSSEQEATEHNTVLMSKQQNKYNSQHVTFEPAQFRKGHIWKGTNPKTHLKNDNVKQDKSEQTQVWKGQF